MSNRCYVNNEVLNPQHSVAVSIPVLVSLFIPSLADNSKYVAAVSFILFFKACTKGYVHSQLVSG